MSVLGGLLKGRSRRTVMGVCLLGLVLVAAVVVYTKRGRGTPAAVRALGESERAWLAERDQLRFAGRSNEAPFGFSEEDGTYRGYEVDLAETLGPVLGVGIDVVPMSREEALIALANGEVDAVAGLARTPANSDSYEFSEPYASSALAIFVRADRFDVTRLADLRGHEVAVQAGTEAQRLLEREPEISVTLVQTAEEGLRSVADAEVVALLADEIAGLGAVQKADLQDEIKLAGLPQETVTYAFAVPKDSVVSRDVLNHALASIAVLGLKQQVDRAWLGAPVVAAAPSGSGTQLTILLFAIVAGLFVTTGFYWLRKTRRGAEERTASLQESREKHQRVVEGIDEAVFTVSGDLSLLEVNNRLESLTGYHKDSLLTMSLEDLVTVAQRQAVRACVESAYAEGVSTLDGVFLVDRLGDEVPVHLSAHALSQAGRSIVQCVVRDVRERERWGKQVRLRTEYLSAVNAIADVVSHSVDTDEMLTQVLGKVLELTRLESGLVYLNSVRDGETVMAPSVKQGLTTPLLKELSWPEGPRRLAEEVAQAGRVLVSSEPGSAAGGGPSTRAGVPLASKDRVHGVMNIYGREPRRFTDEDIALLTTVGNQIGVAIENAQLIQRLQQTAGEMGAMWRFSQSVLQDMTNGLVVVDREAKVRLVNRAGESLLACKEREVLDSSVDELLGRGARLVRDSMERQLAYPGEEILLRRDGGESVFLGMSVSPLRGDGGKVNGAVVMLRDLSREKELEEERIRLDRLALLGEMSAVMAHEIRNPLAGMGAGIQHLLTKFPEGDERHQALQRILGEGERVNRIIEDILLISRPPRLNLAPCDTVDAMEELVGRLRDRAVAQGVEISTDYAPGVPEVRGDRTRLQQALSNLLVNALEAMPNGGQLGISVRGPVRGVVWGDGEAEAVEVVIEDNGSGIKEEDLGKIFDPFVSTKARGTGLGLPIAKRIIEEHKGELKIDSTEGEGTKVTVWLPIGRGAGR